MVRFHGMCVSLLCRRHANAKWLQKVMKDECFHDFLARSDITWQFNLSRSPWWGGQFERLIGLVKQALQKSISRGSLNWRELCEIITDVEVGYELC